MLLSTVDFTSKRLVSKRDFNKSGLIINYLLQLAIDVWYTIVHLQINKLYISRYCNFDVHYISLFYFSFICWLVFTPVWFFLSKKYIIIIIASSLNNYLISIQHLIICLDEQITKYYLVWGTEQQRTDFYHYNL